MEVTADVPKSFSRQTLPSSFFFEGRSSYRSPLFLSVIVSSGSKLRFLGNTFDPLRRQLCIRNYSQCKILRSRSER